MSLSLAVPFAISGGTLMIAFVFAMFAAVAFGFYTFKGSAIDQHPHDGGDSAPGSAGPSEVAGGRTSEDHPEGQRNIKDAFGSRGTR